MKIGADYNSGKCRFTVWSPFAQKVELRIIEPKEQLVQMEKDSKGYWHTEIKNLPESALYLYRIDNEKERPDPASNFQPDGVHKPSQVVDHNNFKWEDENWKGINIKNYVIYELHIGAFTKEGTFEAVIPRLKELKELGITAIEIMPVSQFPGDRNWGYDGVYPFAPQNSYGGVEGLKKLINECHKTGMAVILDVVYNHFGPEGNYTNDYGPYFTSHYRTPWGDAINFDSQYSDEVRNYFFQNALHWFKNFHFDALRLDAIHSIYDMSAKHFLEELSEITDELSNESGWKRYLIAESDLNDDKIIRPRKFGGYGCDAQWSDDYHHSLHSLLTNESLGYYLDFGKLEHLSESIKNGYVYSGKYSQYRKRRHGNSADERPGFRFVISNQNHDQIGNRAFGERTSNLISFEQLKLAAAAMLISPYVPMIFMGEEYGEDNPFLYFVSHGDENLVKAVQEGRKKEFEAFKWQGEIPDPQSEYTFNRSKLDWQKKQNGKYKTLYDWHKTLLKLRKKTPALKNFDRNDIIVEEIVKDKILKILRVKRENQILALFNFDKNPVETDLQNSNGNWKKILDSEDENWGSGNSVCPEILEKQKIKINGLQFVLYQKK